MLWLLSKWPSRQSIKKGHQHHTYIKSKQIYMIELLSARIISLLGLFWTRTIQHKTHYLKCLALRECEQAPIMTHGSKRLLILVPSFRPGRLLAAVHPDIWEGEGRGRPAPPHHPPGARGPGCVPNRPPRAHTRGCGPALCPGESPTASTIILLLAPPHCSLWLVGSNLHT